LSFRYDDIQLYKVGMAPNYDTWNRGFYNTPGFTRDDRSEYSRSDEYPKNGRFNGNRNGNGVKPYYRKYKCFNKII